MYEDIEDNGGMWRYSHWRLWHEKTLSEDYGARRLCCFVVSFSSLLSHRNHRTVKWGPIEQSHSDWSDAQPNPMSLSEDNESKSYPESDESALLIAQVKLSRVFEIWSLDTCQFLNDPGSFRTYQVRLPCGYKYPTPYTINWWLLRVSLQLLLFWEQPTSEAFEREILARKKPKTPRAKEC